MIWRCRFGFHDWFDLQRREETFDQLALEECVRCGKWRSVIRPFWRKDGPMHPRVENGS